MIVFPDCKEGDKDCGGGVGYPLENWKGDKTIGFSVSDISDVQLNDIQTHEWGHNLGAAHADDQPTQPGPNKIASYAASWFFEDSEGNEYRTIMAYNTEKPDFGGTEVPYFSTPLKQYKDSGVDIGDDDRGDNVKLMKRLIPKVAVYYKKMLDPDNCGPD